MTRRALVLDRPDLDLSGRRKPEACGKTTLGEVETICRTEGKKLGLEMACRQSNSEGELDTWIEMLPGVVRRTGLERRRLRPYLDCAARRAARA